MRGALCYERMVENMQIKELAIKSEPSRSAGLDSISIVIDLLLDVHVDELCSDFVVYFYDVWLLSLLQI